MLKSIYREFNRFVENLVFFVYIFKTWVWEWISIFSKNNLVSSVKHTREQSIKIERYWNDVYGKKISTRWHKLYQSINGVFNEKYLPDIIFSTQIEPKLNPIGFARFYSDKGLTELLYSGIFGVSFPKTILLKSGGFFYNSDRELICYSQALSVLGKEKEFVIKPTLGGSSGHGVCVVDDDFDEREIISKYYDNFIIQEKLSPHFKYSNLYSESVNTIRLITYIADDQLCHAPVSLRLGTSGSKVDNIHSGGLVIGVTDEGKLLEYAYRLGYCDSQERYSKHPDSGVAFLDYQVPAIPSVIEIGKRLHSRTPKIGIVSWDFMIDIKGNIVLVEGNYFGQSVWFTQIVHGSPVFGDNLPALLR